MLGTMATEPFGKRAMIREYVYAYAAVTTADDQLDWMLEDKLDANCLQNPKELMAYLGLVPSEHSSGDRIRRGGITKTGNSHARRICVESVWLYRCQARVTQLLSKRHKGLPKDIV